MGSLATSPVATMRPAHFTRPDSALRMGVLGYGYWGPNIVRNLYGLPRAQVTLVCDVNPRPLRRARHLYPQLRLTTCAGEALTDPRLDAVAIITPVWTHFELAKAALENGKHVFVEKPFTSTAAQAEQLVELAARRKLIIMVDHTFLFTAAVRKIHELIEGGTLGDVYYYDSMRINLGLFQHDVNVIWDLAPHDLSIMDYLLQEQAEAVSATGQKHLDGLEDVAFITIYFPGRTIAHINVNWLSPVKVRTTLIGGERKMLVWNDLAADEKIKVYDRGVNLSRREDVYELLVRYRSGDMWAPHLEQGEALRSELDYFLDCVLNGKQPINDGAAGLRVLKLLEAASNSLRKRGELVYV